MARTAKNHQEVHLRCERQVEAFRPEVHRENENENDDDLQLDDASTSATHLGYRGQERYPSTDSSSSTHRPTEIAVAAKNGGVQGVFKAGSNLHIHQHDDSLEEDTKQAAEARASSSWANHSIGSFYLSTDSTVPAAGAAKDNFPSAETMKSQSEVQVIDTLIQREPDDTLHGVDATTHLDTNNDQPNFVFVHNDHASLQDLLQHQHALYHDAQTQDQAEGEAHGRQDKHGEAQEMSGHDFSQIDIADNLMGMGDYASSAMKAGNVPENASHYLSQDDALDDLDLDFVLLGQSPEQSLRPVALPLDDRIKADVLHALTHENINGAADIFNNNRAHFSEASMAEIALCALQHWDWDIVEGYFPDFANQVERHPFEAPMNALAPNELANEVAQIRLAEEAGDAPQADPGVIPVAAGTIQMLAVLAPNELANEVAQPRVAEEDGGAQQADLGVIPVVAVTNQDVLMYYNVSGDTLSFTDVEDAFYPHHDGTRTFRENYQQQHVLSARANNRAATERLGRELVQRVLNRPGRFLIRQLDDPHSWHQMENGEVEAHVIQALSQRCFIANSSKERDFFLGKGGHAPTANGHQHLLGIRNERGPEYLAVVGKMGKKNEKDAIAEKTRIAQEVINTFYDDGGRFLKKVVVGRTELCYIVDDKTMVQKLKQKLCEYHDPAAAAMP